MTEYLLNENPNRFVTSDIKHQDMWDAYMNQRKAFWTEHEVDIEPDLKDWVKLNSNEKHFIKIILAFFAASDGIVMENIGIRFFKEIQIPEARLFYSFQLMMEGIHSIMYSNLIDTYISNEEEKKHLFNAIENYTSIKQKAQWAIKYINNDDSFATRLVAFACVEGIFFSGSFCSIFWLAEKGILPGLCKSNEFISRDEGLHTDFACLLYTYINKKLTYEEIKDIIDDAVKIEIEFITEALPCSLLGMNSENMSTYIKFVANRLSKQLGYNEIYKDIKNPFDFMERICLTNKSNFFEQRVSEYQINDTKIDLNNISFDDENF